MKVSPNNLNLFTNSKVCEQCGVTKNLINYHLNPKAKDGRRRKCRDCRNAARRAKRAKDPEKYRQEAREYYSKNKDKCREWAKQNRASNKQNWSVKKENIPGTPEHERKKAYMKDYAKKRWADKTEEEHIKLKQYQRDWRKKNPFRDIQSNQWRQTTFRGRLGVIKQGAKRRDIPWGLSDDQVKTFWQQPCHYCGQPIDSVGLDRKDNSLGYVLENCVSCCKVCNYMKNGLGYEEFKQRILLISRHLSL